MTYVEGEAPKALLLAFALGRFLEPAGALLGFMVLALPWRGSAKNEVGLDDIPAEDVLQLVECKGLVKEHVVEYLRIRNRAELAERGAERCKSCDALFVPVADKPWTLAGYCSRPCGLEHGAAPVVFRANDAPVERRATIVARCGTGHEFAVLASFAGCVRPCPTCGERVCIELP